MMTPLPLARAPFGTFAMTGRPTIGIFGLGAFGRLLATRLAPFAPILGHDPCADAPEHVTPAPPEDVAACDIVILAVPVQRLAACLHQIAPHLRPGALVIDVASVKVEPLGLMTQILPAHVQILGSHPMFGPQSVDQPGLTCVLCPVRGNDWHRVAAFLRWSGLRVVITSAETHDREAAVSQGLTHLLARAFLGRDRPAITTRSFDAMLAAFEMVAQDTPDLFEAITARNTHVVDAREWLVGELAGRQGCG